MGDVQQCKWSKTENVNKRRGKETGNIEVKMIEGTGKRGMKRDKFLIKI